MLHLVQTEFGGYHSRSENTVYIAVRKTVSRKNCFYSLGNSLRKRGFAVPLAQWFRTTWRGQLEMHLLEGKAVKNNYLNAPALEKLLKEHHQCCRDHSELIGNLLMLELFLENEI